MKMLTIRLAFSVDIATATVYCFCAITLKATRPIR